MRNNGTPDRMKYLGILSTNEWKINPLTQEEYDLHTDDYANCIKKAYNENIAQKYIKKDLAKWITGYKEYDYDHPSIWVEKKRDQLQKRLNNVAHIVAFIKLYLKGYRLVTYDIWPYMSKWLANPKYYKHLNNGNVNYVKSSEYA